MGGKRSLKPNGLFNVQGKRKQFYPKRNFLKPNGFFLLSKRAIKPNGLFSTMKRGLKPNGLFSAIKRGLADYWDAYESSFQAEIDERKSYQRERS